MLLNDFFYIRHIHFSDKYEISIEINPLHKIFTGHFPNNPVTPGVCFIQMVKETIEHITKKELLLLSSSNIKFLAVLNPATTATATLTIVLKEKEERLIQIESTVSYKEVTFFSFKGIFKEN